MEILEAFNEVKKLHSGQYRKGCDIPYWTHLRDVASLVKYHGGSKDQILAALFHDSIEDQDVSYDWLAQKAGENVAKIVLEMSKSKDITGWDARFEDYIQRLTNCSEDTKLVVMADKVSNLTDIRKDYDILGDTLWSRFSKGSDTLQIQYTRYLKLFDGWGPLPDYSNLLRIDYKDLLYSFFDTKQQDSYG